MPRAVWWSQGGGVFLGGCFKDVARERDVQKSGLEAGAFKQVTYRGTSLKRNRPTLGPYSRHAPRALW